MPLPAGPSPVIPQPASSPLAAGDVRAADDVESGSGAPLPTLGLETCCYSLVQRFRVLRGHIDQSVSTAVERPGITEPSQVPGSHARVGSTPLSAVVSDRLDAEEAREAASAIEAVEAAANEEIRVQVQATSAENTSSTSGGSCDGSNNTACHPRVGDDIYGLEGVKDPKRQLLGTRFVPIDLMLEQVRSLGVQSFLILTMVFMATSHLILGDKSNLNCHLAMPPPTECGVAPHEIDAETLAEVILQSKALCLLLLLSMGLMNSRYFTRGCGMAGVWCARVSSVCMGGFLVWLAMRDMAYCDARAASAVDLCSSAEGHGPVMGFVLDAFGDAMQANAKWATVLGAAVGSICDSTVAINVTMAACTQTVGAELCDLNTLACACKELMSCYTAFENRVPTAVRAGTFTMLLWCLFAASLWDLLHEVLPHQVGQLALACRSLARRVPLTLISAVILDFNWCTIQASRLSPRFWQGVMDFLHGVAGLPQEPWRTILVFAVPGFLLMQLLICVVAAVYNVRMYLHHTRLMAALPWSFFCEEVAEATNDDAGASRSAIIGKSEVQLREAGLDPRRIRKANNMWAPYYFGVVWASFLLGAAMVAVFPTVLVAAFIVLALAPAARHVLWWMFFGPIYSSLAVYCVLTFAIASSQSCLWGNKEGFPRRPALLAICDAWLSMALLYASPVLALVRFLKSALMSMIGMLVVTRPGTHEGLAFGDACHSYYLSILRVERFRLEVKRWGPRNTKLGPTSFCSDCFSGCIRTSIPWALAIFMYCVLARLCGISWEASYPEAIKQVQLLPARDFVITAEQSF